MSNRNFNIILSIIFLGGIVSTFLLLILLNVVNNFNDVIASGVNFIIIFFNLLFGIFIIRKTLRKENKRFLLEFFGSMVIRVIFLLIFVFSSLAIFKLPLAPFIFSFFGYYLFALVFELSYLSKFIKTNFIIENKT